MSSRAMSRSCIRLLTGEGQGGPSPFLPPLPLCKINIIQLLRVYHAHRDVMRLDLSHNSHRTEGCFRGRDRCIDKLPEQRMEYLDAGSHVLQGPHEARSV